MRWENEFLLLYIYSYRKLVLQHAKCSGRRLPHKMLPSLLRPITQFSYIV